MIGEIHENILAFLKTISPISIVSNIVFGALLLVIGLILLSKKQQQTRGKKIGGWICISISILALLGAISNWLFSYVIFAYNF